MDKEAQEWIEAIISEKFPAGQSYEDVLKDGQVLCKLINVLSSVGTKWLPLLIMTQCMPVETTSNECTRQK